MVTLLERFGRWWSQKYDHVVLLPDIDTGIIKAMQEEAYRSPVNNLYCRMVQRDPVLHDLLINIYREGAQPELKSAEFTVFLHGILMRGLDSGAPILSPHIVHRVREQGGHNRSSLWVTYMQPELRRFMRRYASKYLDAQQFSGKGAMVFENTVGMIHEMFRQQYLQDLEVDLAS